MRYEQNEKNMCREEGDENSDRKRSRMTTDVCRQRNRTKDESELTCAPADPEDERRTSESSALA